MQLPLSYTLRSLFQRKTSTFMTIGSFALVTFVLLALLSMIQGIERTLIASGARDRLFAISSTATTENQSRLKFSDALKIESAEGVKLNAKAGPMSSLELVATTYIERPGLDRLQVNYRGVELDEALAVHNGAGLTSGRWFRSEAYDEVVVGKGLATSLGMGTGDKFEAQNATWRIVGVFEDDGSPFESEVWVNRTVMDISFKRDYVSSVWMVAQDPDQTQDLVERLNDSKVAQIYATTETDYFAQGASTAKGLQALTWFVAAIMAVGTIFSAMNTMYASLGDRTQELGTLRAIGFDRGAVIWSALIESMIMSTTGGVVACFLAYFVDGITFRTPVPGVGLVTFQFTMTLGLILTGLIFSTLLGLIGGWFPARHAMNIPVVEAIKG